MTRLGPTLSKVLRALPGDRFIALVGGIAASVRTEPCFTRRLDFALAVQHDEEAEHALLELERHGFSVVAKVEHTTARRFATAQLRESADTPIVELLFASCGIEPEIVADSSPLQVLGVNVSVATVGHLVAMKLVSDDPERRPRDHQELVALASVADEREWQRAHEAIGLIQQRGFSRGRDLPAGLAEIRGLVG